MGLPNTTTPQTYGLPKEDFGPIINPLREISSTEFESIACDLASLTHVSPRAWARVESGEIVEHAAVWGDTESVKPTIQKVSDGVFTLTWAESFSNLNPTPQRAETVSPNFRFAVVTCVNPSASDCPIPCYSVDAANVVTVYLNSIARAVESSATRKDCDFTVVVF